MNFISLKLFRNFASFTGLKSIGLALSTIYVVYLGKVLGAEDLGFYYVVINILSLSMVISKLGYDNYILRELTTFKENKDFNGIAHFVKKTFKYVFVSSLICTILLVLFSGQLANYLLSSSTNKHLVILVSTIVFVHTMTYLLSDVVKALGYVNSSVWSPYITFPLINLVGVSLFYEGLRLEVVINIVVFSAWISFLIVLFKYTFYFRDSKVILNAEGLNNIRLAKYDFKIIPVSFYAISISNFVFASIDTFLLAYLATPEDVGIFSIIMRVLLPFSTLLLILNGFFARQFSVLLAKKDINNCNRLFWTVLSYCLVVSFILLILIIYFGKPILEFFGEEFRAGYPPLVVMALGFFVSLATGPCAIYLMMGGFERQYKSVLLLTGLIGIALSIVLIAKFGLIGAAISVCASLVLKNSMALALVINKFGFFYSRGNDG